GPGVNQMWDHTHRLGSVVPTGGQGQGAGMRDAYVAGDLADAMRKNPRLHVFSLNGLFELATPFFITEYDLAHIELEPKLRSNIDFAFFPPGHRVHLNWEPRKQLKKDLAPFNTKVAPGGERKTEKGKSMIRQSSPEINS